MSTGSFSSFIDEPNRESEVRRPKVVGISAIVMVIGWLVDLDLGVPIDPYVQPHFERVATVYIVRTKDGEAIDGIEASLKKTGRETLAFSPIKPVNTRALIQPGVPRPHHPGAARTPQRP